MAVWKGKWNYKACFLGDVTEASRVKHSVAYIFKRYPVEMIDVNAFEMDAIFCALDGLESLLGRLDLCSIPISLTQIIITTEKEFRSKVCGDPNVHGKTWAGLAYVYRQENKVAFLRTLTHEIAHLASFYRLRIKHFNGKDNASVANIGFCHYDVNRNVDYFGFNEAATELFALELRKEIAAKYSLLSKKQSEDLLSSAFYLPQLVLLSNILYCCGNPAHARFILHRSYIKGTDDFYRLLNMWLPGASQKLSLLSRSQSSAFRVAEEIGGEPARNELASKFKKYKESIA